MEPVSGKMTAADLAAAPFDPVPFDLAKLEPTIKHHARVIALAIGILTKTRVELVEVWKDDELADAQVTALEEIIKTQEWLDQTREFLKTAELRLLSTAPVENT